MQRLFDTSDLLVGKKPGTYPTPAPYLDDRAYYTYKVEVYVIRILMHIHVHGRMLLIA